MQATWHYGLFFFLNIESTEGHKEKYNERS